MSARTWIVKLLQQLKLNRIAHKIYYDHIHSFDTANRAALPALERCLSKAVELGTVAEGDYLEFGLFKGYSFWYAQRTADNLLINNMRFFGFDSFQGLPEVSDIDKTPHSEFYKGQYACTKDKVIESLNSKGVDWTRTKLIAGFYNETLTPELRSTCDFRKVAVALIDCDLYETTKDVLNFLQPLIFENTILMFDDWNCFDSNNDKGQRRAFAEFMAYNEKLSPEDFFSYGDYGHVFIMGTSKNPGAGICA